tara:strand:+ start:336 stop:803 length:468 start_codon:yes stop_codon:yes gene_type:complete
MGKLKKPKANQKGLKKLPQNVRNKMGYMMSGGMYSPSGIKMAGDKTALASAKQIQGMPRMSQMKKGGAKPDYLDMDGDGNKTESMKSAVKSKKSKMKHGGKHKKKKMMYGKGGMKKKMYGGMKPAAKKGMGGSKKAMYKTGGFLSEPSTFDLDND